MKTTWMIMLTVAAIASMGAGGCDGDDGRLAEYAKNSVDQQTRQNDQIARQNQAVTQQNRHVAEAAEKLVEADARARQEMVTAQRALQEDWHVERLTLDQQRRALDEDRQRIARDRYWEPLVAQAISGCGVLLGCLLPLLVCLYLLRGLRSEKCDESVLNELLVAELTAERPQLLLPSSERQRAFGQELSSANDARIEDPDSEPPPF